MVKIAKLVDSKLLEKNADNVTVVKFLLAKAEAKKKHKSFLQRNHEVDRLITSLFLSGDLS